jgi:imidazoleglycerol-phosphate dehydratase
MTRRVSLSRKTLETEVRVELDLDGTGQTEVSTGVGLFDHLLRSLAHHALFDLVIESRGDLEVDDHHTVEDTARVLGQALAEALGDREGIVRFGDAAVPMDEAMATAAVDAGGRPYAAIDLPFRAERIGMLSTQMVPHALEAFSRAAGITLHLSGRGRNDHHLAEAAFKALARALRQAVEPDSHRSGSISLKGPPLAGRRRKQQEEPREDGGALPAGPTSSEEEGDLW